MVSYESTGVQSFFSARYLDDGEGAKGDHFLERSQERSSRQPLRCLYPLAVVEISKPGREKQSHDDNSSAVQHRYHTRLHFRAREI